MIPNGYSYVATAGWFVAGAAVTAVFSGSLAVLAKNAGWIEVLTTGMIVPSFTWVVQFIASAIGLSPEKRQIYWGDLGRACLYGSFALLPAAFANLCIPGTPLWISAANVLVSVVLMAIELFRLSARHAIAVGWPISWCFTITFNMCLFVLSSWHWW